MPTWLIVIVVVLFVLAVGGFIARSILTKRTEGEFRRRLERANHDLAEAAAEDRGWDRGVLEAAARQIYAKERGIEPSELLLVEVLDRPGTEDDAAIFHVEGEGRTDSLTLGRRDGEWVFDSLG